jgi:hypothetical protein
MSTTIDAAIIKALVEHVGGDSSGIPDGTIGGGGTTYTAGNGIEISDENVISVADHQHTNLTTLTINQGLTSNTITTNLISCIDEKQGITLSANKVNIDTIEISRIQPSNSSIDLSADITIPTGFRLSLGHISDLEQTIAQLQSKVQELESRV